MHIYIYIYLHQMIHIGRKMLRPFAIYFLLLTLTQFEEVSSAAVLRMTISSEEAKVGDTVIIRCSFTSPQNPFLIQIDQRTNGVKERLATNGFLSSEFQDTGRYNATAECNDKAGGKELLVTITITDAKVEDSGRIECLAPSVRVTATRELKVSEPEQPTEVLPTISTVSMRTDVSPQNVEVGDTVRVTCTLNDQIPFAFLRIIRFERGKKEEIGVNSFLNSKFKQTGRYKAEANINRVGASSELVVTITISDAQLEDSGYIGCEVPSVGLVSYKQLTVSQ